MIPIEFTKSRLRLTDFAEAVKYGVRYRRGDVIANAVVIVAVVLAAIVGSANWVLAGTLLTLPVIAVVRLVVATAVGVRDARDVLAYFDGMEFDEDAELADVIHLDSGTEANL